MELETGVDFLEIDVPIKFSMCSYQLSICYHHVHQVPNVILKMFPIALHFIL
jgi:hypothetical protein